MKSKEQKRLEAIQRLERPVAVDRYYAHNRAFAAKIEERRRTEAMRLRMKFKLALGEVSAP